MKRLIDIFKRAKLGWTFSAVSILLIISSFILPPTGIIDPSVLAAVGEIFAFATLYKLPDIISSVKDGKSVKVSSGDVSVEVSSEKES